MIHPATELRLVDATIGFGVHATAMIPMGTIVWALDPLDRVLSRADLDSLPGALGFNAAHHLWHREDDSFVLAWDLARFMNHSCSPTCVTTPLGCEIAIRDIAPGEQLTNDYAELGMVVGETLHCGCGAPRCRQVIVCEQAPGLRATYAPLVAAALNRASQVDQPLASLLPPNIRAQFSSTVAYREAPRPRRVTERRTAAARVQHDGAGSPG